jgi:hypothetical protein
MRAFQPSRAKYPLATISAYGPDNRRATKLVVGILRRAGQKSPAPMRSWSTDTTDVRNDPVVAAEWADWLHSQGIKDTLSYDRIIGCPHEEGIDYPMGRTCPQCPFWAGIDRFTHEPISAPIAKMSPNEVLIELAKDRTTHPLEALGSADAHRGVLVQPLLDVLDAASAIPTPLRKKRPSSSAMRCTCWPSGGNAGVPTSNSMALIIRRCLDAAVGRCVDAGRRPHSRRRV